MDTETVKKLDEIEQKLVERLDYQIRNGYLSDTANTSQTLVNIAMYRRLRAGDKMRVRSDGTAFPSR